MDGENKEKDGLPTDAGSDTSANLEGTSAAEALTSMFEEGKSYSGAEVVKNVGKVIQDALSADGRVQKGRADAAEAALNTMKTEHEGLKTQFQTVSDQVSTLLKAQDDAEADKVKDQPEALASLRTRQANRAEQIRLEGVKSSLDARETQINETKTNLDKREVTLNIREVAGKHEVDAKQLEDLVPDGNPDRLERMAKILKQSGSKPEEDPNKGKKETPNALNQKPASAISSGGDQRGLSAKLLDKAKSK